MKYDINSNSLYTDSDELIKTLSCPLHKAWRELAPYWPGRDRLLQPQRIFPRDRGWGIRLFPELEDPRPPATNQRWCCDCDKAVVSIADYDEKQVQAIVEQDPDICIHCPLDHPKMRWVSGTVAARPPSCATRGWEKEIPFIRTLRQPQAILSALREGKQLLIFFNTDKSSRLLEQAGVKSRKALHKYYALMDNEQAYLELFECNPPALNMDGYDSYGAESLRAAYIIPRDLKPGTKILVGDLIEPLILSRLRGGDRYYRSSMAMWNGKYPDYTENTELRVRLVG